MRYETKFSFENEIKTDEKLQRVCDLQTLCAWSEGDHAESIQKLSDSNHYHAVAKCLIQSYHVTRIKSLINRTKSVFGLIQIVR